MVVWIRRFSRLMSGVIFFLVFFAGINPANPFEPDAAFAAFIKAAVGASLFWFAAFIISDITLKGVVEDIRTDDIDITEGGLLQHIRDHRTGRDETADKEQLKG